MELTLPEKFILLTLNSRKGYIHIPVNNYKFGLVGAVLMKENEMTKIISDTLAQINAAIIASVSAAAVASSAGGSS